MQWTVNEVICFRRAANGSLQQDDRFATGGRGTGGVAARLESQGSLTLSEDHGAAQARHRAIYVIEAE